MEENPYVILEDSKKMAEENQEEEMIEGEEEKILNTDKQEDIAIEDVELAPAEPQPAVSSNTLKEHDIEVTASAGPGMVYIPDPGHSDTDENPAV